MTVTEIHPGDGYEPGFDRQPPQDLLAEQCVLGGMLLSKDAIADVVEVLRGADFYKPAHETIYDDDRSTCTAAGSRPTRSPWRTPCSTSGELAAHRRRRPTSTP